MPIEVQEEKGLIKISEIANIDDAEILFEAIQQDKEFGIDLSECSHLHTSCIQVLFLTRPRIVSFPKDDLLCIWLSFLK